MKKSLIGRKYLPIDNSYSVNITKSVKLDDRNELTKNRGFIAGTSVKGDHPHLCILVTDPFTCAIDVNLRTPNIKNVEMVVVKDLSDGQFHTVMFLREGLNVYERIQAINKHSELTGAPMFGEGLNYPEVACGQ